MNRWTESFFDWSGSVHQDGVPVTVWRLNDENVWVSLLCVQGHDDDGLWPVGHRQTLGDTEQGRQATSEEHWWTEIPNIFNISKENNKTKTNIILDKMGINV